jgi:hypothetical protein
MHRVIRRIGDASARRPWVTIGTWAVAAAVVMGLAGTAGGAFADDFVAPGSQSEEAMELLEARFPEAAGGSAMAVFAAPEGERLERQRPAIDAAVARPGAGWPSLARRVVRGRGQLDSPRGAEAHSAWRWMTARPELAYGWSVPADEPRRATAGLTVERS